MKIILIGFMGSGKSAVAEQLAKKLGWAKIEMDELALKKSQRKDINTVFSQDGEACWRELEIAVAKKLKTADKTVIATGGGVVMNQIIFAYLKNKPDDKIIYLETLLTTVCHRLQSDKIRPLFTDIKKVKVLFDLRKPLYRHYADITISTNGKTPANITKKIIKKLQP